MVGWDFLGLPWVYLPLWSNIPAPSMGFRAPKLLSGVNEPAGMKHQVGKIFRENREPLEDEIKDMLGLLVPHVWTTHCDACFFDSLMM